MLNKKFEAATVVTPSFPNWQKSFVSGPQSILYQVEHRMTAEEAGVPHPTLLTNVRFKNKAEGPPKHVHGGASAALIDEVMGILIWNQKIPVVTQALNLKYLKPIPLSIDGYVVTEIKSVNDKQVEITATIYSKDKTAYVSAEGTFHRLTAEQLKKYKA